MRSVDESSFKLRQALQVFIPVHWEWNNLRTVGVILGSRGLKRARTKGLISTGRFPQITSLNSQATFPGSYYYSQFTDRGTETQD